MKRRRALLLVALLALATLAIAGFRALRAPIEHQIAVSTADQVFGSHRLNVLLLGYQADEGTSDTVLLAHLDIDRRTATLVSIPRDSWVAIPGHGHDKINAAIGLGGPSSTARVVSQLIGQPIDGTIAVQPDAAKAIVDAMGGINVDVDETMNYDDNAGGLHIHLHKGEQYLTGGQVLEYIRFRHDAASDWGRVRRQQRVIKDILAQVGQPQQWAKLPHLLDIAGKNIRTTLSQAQITALMKIYRGVPDDNVRTFTMPGRAGWAGDASVVYLDEHWAHLIGSLLFDKHEPPQDNVLVVNATGNVAFDSAVIGALRGGGWNVSTFVDSPKRPHSRIVGSTVAASALGMLLPDLPHVAGATTTLVLGSDLAPQAD